MAVKLKANVQYINAIETIQRKFVPKKVKVHSGEGTYGPVELAKGDGFMGGAQRQSYRPGLGLCTRNYLFIKTEGRTSALSSHEFDLRLYFKRACVAKNTLRRDLSQFSRIQTMFHAGAEDLSKKVNGVSTRGYTMWGWVMAVQYAGIYNDPEHYNELQFPQDFDA